MDSGNHFCEKSEAVPVKKVSKAMKQYFFIVMFGLMMIYIIRRARLPSSFSHSLRVLVYCREAVCRKGDRHVALFANI